VTTLHTKCRICGNSNLIEVLDLGNQVLSCVFPSEAECDPSHSPLVLVKCQSNGNSNSNVCGLVQLKHTAEVSEMYGTTYGYHSSLSPTMVKHLESKVNQLVSLVKPQKNDLILDIGCNDGTLLNAYEKYGEFQRFGIDPSSEKFKHFFQPDVDVTFDFFSGKVAQAKFGDAKCKIITSIAMFYDLDDPRSFVNDVAYCLHEQGIWSLELSYLPMLLNQLTYDQICHEHVTYYGLRELQYLFVEAGLKVIDISFNDINGGSIYLLVAHRESKYSINQDAIHGALLQERNLQNLETYERYSRRINQHKDDVRQFFEQCKLNGKSVYGYGASTKGNIVLNFCGISREMLPAIGDLNTEKHGRFTPGTRIPIWSHEKIKEFKPDYLFVLVWHFRTEVIRSEMHYLESGGKLVFHLPRFHIVTKDNYHLYVDRTFEDLAFSV
jgi:NDP-4-keto-2,6-dideoxyhexose 3-C-methyltransferase